MTTSFAKYCIYDPNKDTFLKYSKADIYNEASLEFVDDLLPDSPHMVFNSDYMPVFDIKNNSLQVVPVVNGECDWANYISFLEFAVLYLDKHFGDVWRK